MPRSRDKRLARLAARRTNGADETRRHRANLAARVALGAAIRHSLTRFGIDAATVKPLRVCDEAAAELAATPSPRPTSRARRGSAPVRVRSPRPRGRDSISGAADSEFWSQIERLAQRFLERPEPGLDLGAASLIEIIAWCVAQQHLRPSRRTGRGNTGAVAPKSPPVGGGEFCC
jgi:hypothetical protein